MAKDKGKTADDPEDDADGAKSVECVIAEVKHECDHGTSGAKAKAGGFESAFSLNPGDFLPILLALLNWWKEFRKKKDAP